MANARHQISITKRVCPKFCGFPPNHHQGQEVTAGVERQRGKALPSPRGFRSISLAHNPAGRSRTPRRPPRTAAGRLQVTPRQPGACVPGRGRLGAHLAVPEPLGSLRSLTRPAGKAREALPLPPPRPERPAAAPADRLPGKHGAELTCLSADLCTVHKG